MPSKDAHLWQAKHNETLFSQLLTTEFLDWAVTAIFYSALHHVDAYLATKDIHPSFHYKGRDRWVATESNLRHIWNQYRWLKEKSEAARYDVKHFTQSEVNHLKQSEFEIIKSHISKLKQGRF